MTPQLNPKFLLAFLLVFTLVLPAVAAKKDISDNELHDAVMRRLADDQIVKGGGLEVEVQAGVVTLKGSVEFDNQKSRAEKLAKKVGGVKNVVNQITVKHPGLKAPK